MTALEIENRRETEELVPANLAVGSRLLAAATVFAFMGPAFAYFYLRSLNSNGMWRPQGVHPPQTYGAAVVALLVVSAVALAIAPRTSHWRAAVACSLAFGLAGVGVQCVEYTQLSFGPMSGSFALATVLWLETLLAYGLRHSDAPPSIVGPRLSALSFYWTFLAGLGVIMWAILYLV
jgi:heme/copper-type cytochrome/quinol oxidase subunit 3